MKVTMKDVADFGGRQMIRRYYDGSLYVALASLYPHVSWPQWALERVDPAFWDVESHRLAFLTWFEKRRGIELPHEWFSVTKLQIVESGGQHLLRRFGGSLPQLLAAHYPEEPWHAWLFARVCLVLFTCLCCPLTAKCPKKYWNELASQREFCDWLSKKRGMSALSEWYEVGVLELRDNGAHELTRLYKSSMEK